VLIVFALVYAVWQMPRSLRAVMDALNAIVECDESRPTLYRYGLSLALATVVIALIACALFIVAGSDRLLGTSGGVLHWLIAVLRWPTAAIFLGLAVGIVARFAPVERRGARWAGVGAALIVVAWLVESAVYAWFLENVASYKSASGNLLLLIVLTTYLYISSVVFLVGAQLDEFLREESRGQATTLGIHEVARRLF